MTDVKATVKKGGKNQPIIVNQVIVKPVNRSLLSMDKWTNALKSADNGRYKELFDLYELLMTDGILADAIEKRIRAVKGADLTFQFADGTESDEMIDLIDTDEFEYMLEEIMKSIFEFITVIEFDFSNGFDVYSAPRKHIRADKKLIAINESDYDTGISYADAPNVIEIKNRSTKYGLLHRAAPYVILQRGGLGDWAQMVELFGMPQRVGKYSIYDTEARKQLQEAFDAQGAASTLIVPKETDIETNTLSGNGGGGLYKDFIETLQEFMLITILSQTMTTKDGSSMSQSKVHKDVEEELNKADLRFVQRILNKKLKPILEARGYKVKDGAFNFPKALKDLTVDELISLSDIIEIPAYYFHDKYGLPQPAEGDIIAKKAAAPTPSADPNAPTPPDPATPPVETGHATSKKPKDVKLSDSDRNLFEKMFDFFADARTLWSRATGLNLADKSTSYTTNTNIDKLFEQAIKDIYKQYGLSPSPSGDGAGGEVVSKPLFDISNNALQHGIDNAFSVEFGKTDPEFINQFKTNAAVFSAFKTHAQGKEIVAQLIDADGNLKSYDKFRKSVLGKSIKADYNENWLKTEYNMAVRSARMAEKWKGFERTKHLYPNLEFMESTAAEKRLEHLNWVGTILPIEHPWWNTHTPPVGWGCECSIENTDKDVTTAPGYDEPVTPVFANNPGKTAEFINLEEHPMVKGVCKDFSGCKTKLNLSGGMKPECQICVLAKRYFKHSKKYEKVIEREYDNGGKIYISNLVNQSEGDYKRVLTCADFFARQGQMTEILPKPYKNNPIYKHIFGKLIGTKYENKCPDLSVNGIFYEHEGFITGDVKNAALNMLRRGLKQSDRIIMDDCGISGRFLLKSILLRVKAGENIEEVWILQKNGDLKLVFKKTEAQ